jgi:16S rRNA (guanine(527)-N(7))-methyltransferase RsmG
MKNDDLYKAYTLLSEAYSLTQPQVELFRHYIELLNQATCNISAIHDIPEIISYHFADSLELGKAIPLTNQTIIDVGSGGGFPGIPIKIAYPDCHVILIEVIAKKRKFLQNVITLLNLKNITIYEQDWRTFLRTTHFAADLVCARASLPPCELLRMFQTQSSYKNATLVYWASSSWQPTEKEAALLQTMHPYHVGDRERKLVFFTSS